MRLIDKQGTTEEPKDLGTPDEIAREGVYKMLMMALQMEVLAYVERHLTERDTDGRQWVVRNGKAKSRR